MATPFGTHVELMSNVPLNPKYEHTLLFTNKNQQTAYFNSKVLQNAIFTSLSYQRHSGGVIRVAAGMEILDEVNYIRFTNPYHENKAFYAFITDVKYVNENCVEISYSIDVIQTWMFDYNLNPCYVEREHANDDRIGNNRIDECLETGPYITPVIEKIAPWDSIYATGDGDLIQNTTFVIIATQAPDGSQNSSQINGVASSMYIRFAYDVTGLEDILTSFVNGITQSLEPIISIGMMPSGYKPNASNPLIPITYQLTGDFGFGLGAFTRIDTRYPNNMKTYTPKNNKMYCYPYNYITFESPDGSSIILKHEDFDELSSANHHQQFTSYVSVIPEIETVCYPLNYESVLSGTAMTGRYMKYALFSKGYPYCPVASDAFSAWWAQNKYNMPVIDSGVKAATNPKGYTSQLGMGTGIGKKISDTLVRLIGGTGETIKNMLSTATGDIKASSFLLKAAGTALSGDIGGAINLGANAADTIGTQLSEYKGHQAVPDTLVTKANNMGVNHYCENDCYKVHYTKITPEYAEIIDNYFTCFGYATHLVKVPNITCRRYWNYIKTTGCTISGNVPADAEDQIVAIYDKGITFWHDPDAIYNYSLDNAIV